MNTKTILAFSVLLMAASAIVIVSGSEQSDATQYGSYDHPETSMIMTVKEYDDNYGTQSWAYLAKNSPVNLSATTSGDYTYDVYAIWYYDYDNNTFVNAYGVDTGLTITSNSLTGTVNLSYDYFRVDYSVSYTGGFTTKSFYIQVIDYTPVKLYAYVKSGQSGYGSVYIHNETRNESSSSTSSASPVSLTVNQGDSVSFIATPAAGYNFESWLKVGTAQQYYSQEYTITASSQETYSASFTPIQTYTVTLQSLEGGNATLSYGDSAYTALSGGAAVTKTVESGTAVTFSATATEPLMEFYYWANASNSPLYFDNPKTISITSNTTLIAHWAYPECTVTFDATTNGGTIFGSDTKTLRYGEAYGQLPIATKSGYVFKGWFTAASGGTQIFSYTTFESTTDQTLYAQFMQDSPAIGEVYWNNGLYNGTINMVFQYQPNDNFDHTMEMDLYSGITENNITIWVQSGYSLEINTSYPALYVTATLKYGGATVNTNQIRTGNWSTFQLTIDTAEGKLDVAPVNRFNSFIDYTVYESQTRTVLNWSNTITGATVYEITHSDDTSTGSNPVRFSVTSTDVFLETYGVILNNPSINVFDYFPQYSSVRLNFYSFALYGNSITVNGTTYNLSGANVTVSYVNDADNNHYLPSAFPNQSVKTKTMELSNIYVTWDGDNGHCYLTFVNYNFTIDLGEYIIGNETVSFGGLWYFTTQLFEPIQSSQIEIGGWESLPTLDKSQMCLIFLGLLILFGAFAYTKLNASMFDTVIIIAAAVIGFVFLGS